MRLKAVRNLDDMLRPRHFVYQQRECSKCSSACGDCLPLVKTNTEESPDCACHNHVDGSDGQSDCFNRIYKSPSLTGKDLSSDLTVPMLRQVQCDVKEVKTVIKKTWNLLYERENRELDEQAVEVEWQTIALVLDRLFFILYISLIAFSLLLFFPQPL